ncbi:MAG TPA: hypothetical protein VMT34_02225 [Aggregatilineales bacterium]|nr:hypothetical protein [Aggregatilineales bacterium]
MADKNSTAPRRPTAGGGELPARSRGSGCADVITAIFLILTVGVVAYSILLYANPQSVLNPFPPATPQVILVIPTDPPTNTPTKTFTPLPATYTPIPSLTPSFTATIPTNTPTASYTPVIAVARTAPPGATRPPARTAATVHPQYTLSQFPFTVNPVHYVANTTKEGCNWQSIVITALDLEDKPAKGVVAHVSQPPNLDEYDPLNQHSQIGDNTFEVLLGSTPRDDQYTIQLVNRTGGPISDLVTVPTKSACDQNVVVVTFVQNHPYS